MAERGNQDRCGCNSDSIVLSTDGEGLSEELGK
jgi:hypothetical protein